MGRAYKCDRCKSYFDGLTKVVGGQYPSKSRYSGITLKLNAGPLTRKLSTGGLGTYLCPDCAVEFANLFLEFMEPVE